MKQKAAVPTTRSLSVNNTLTLQRLTLDFLDTSWRIAVPVIVFAVLGIVADRALHTAPWLTLAGMVIGFISAGLLIKRQIVAVKQRENAS